MLIKYSIRLISAVSVALLPVSVLSDTVKRSKNGICHDTNSPYYVRVKNYIPYKSIEQCIASGGRLPKVQQGGTPSEPQIDRQRERRVVPIQFLNDTYSRHMFGSWIDADGDCLNTRHELLQKLSTGPITMPDNCHIARGRWLDPYSNKVFYDASDVDIDHLVPLKWAWEHGADQWNQDQRIQFANDERNLYVVEDSLNQSKGALDPTQWLPPNRAFQCQYVVRYDRIVKLYGLKLTHEETLNFSRLRTRVCQN